MTLLDSLIKLEGYTTGTLITYSLITLIVAVATYHLYKRFQYVAIIDRIPGPKAYPFFGNALEMNVEPREFFKLLTIKYCDYNTGISRMWIGLNPYVLIYGPSSTEAILSSQKYINKMSDYRFLQPWLGTGLLTSTGKKWAKRRRLLTPAFHFKILEDFMEVFNNQSNNFIAKLKEKADGKEFNIYKYITLCTLDIIFETAMGIPINAQENPDLPYVKAVYKIANIILTRLRIPWWKPDSLFRLIGHGNQHDECVEILHSYSDKTIKARREEYNMRKSLAAKKIMTKEEKEEAESLGQRQRLAFLDLLLQYSDENESLSDEDLREEVDTFMFEGHDTTSAGVNWSIYLLGENPEKQQKVFDELDSIFGDSDRPITTADIREMKYLECCIKEAQRIFPSVPFIGRELHEDVVIDGYKIPAGTDIMIITQRLHRDTKYFPDPEVFIPERFLSENAAKRHPYAYVPFSAGPRNCIGQKFAINEEKVVLSTFFRNFRVESVVKRGDLKFRGELILRPEEGTLVRLFPRK